MPQCSKNVYQIDSLKNVFMIQQNRNKQKRRFGSNEEQWKGSAFAVNTGTQIFLILKSYPHKPGTVNVHEAF